jgi:hypothetical protein
LAIVVETDEIRIAGKIPGTVIKATGATTEIGRADGETVTGTMLLTKSVATGTKI